MPIIVELPDSTELEFPDGMDQLAMHQEITKAFPQFSEPTPTERAAISPPGQGPIGRQIEAPDAMTAGQVPSETERIGEILSSPENLAFEKAHTTPRVDIPEKVYQTAVNAVYPGLGFVPGIPKLVKTQAEATTSDVGAAQIPWMLAGGAGGVPAKVVSGLFAAQGVEGLTQSVPETIKAAQQRDVAGTVEGLGNTALSGLMVLGGGLGLKEPLRGSGIQLPDAPSKVPPILPRAAEALKEERTPDASSITPTTTEDGNLRSPPGEGARQVPEPQSLGGVQPQTSGGLPKEEAQAQPAVEDLRKPVPVSEVNRIPATENGGRIAIILPNGKAVVGGRIHADTWNKAIDAGVATDAEMADGFAGFVKTDGTAWGVNGKPLPKVNQVFIVGLESPKPPARSSQRPPSPENKPAPPSTEQAPETQAPAEPTVSEAKPPVAATTGGAPAIDQTTTSVVGEQPKTGISVGPGAASPEEVPSSSGGEDITGVAQRVREKVAAAGEEDLPPRGQGIAPEDSVERGRELLKQGADPEKVMAAFEKDQRVSSADMAVARAHLEKVAYDSRRIAEKFGTDSPEWRAAHEARSQWAARTKKMQTEWAKTGHAQQGEVDIDTGEFTSLAGAYRDSTGKDFTPNQEKVAKQKASGVRNAEGQEAGAKEKLFNHIKSGAKQRDAEAAALKTASQVLRDWDVKKANLETKKRVADAKLKTDLDKIAQEREARVRAAADKAAREAAIRAAKEETKQRIAAAQREKQILAEETKREQAALKAAQKVVRDNAIRQARLSAKERELKADLPTYVWDKARDYIDKGMDNFDEIRTKIATDLGVPVDKVTKAMAKDKRAKYLADELWRKQQIARQLKQQAKQWLRDTTVPGYIRALQNIPRFLFGIKVGFHGTVALGTHAPMVAFQPRFWANYVRDFGKMYRMVGAPTPHGQSSARAYYEMQVQDLLRRKNYTTARRAGLVNDPFTYEDFNSPDTAKYFGRLTTMGNRGYSVLKILRQDMFDQMWDKLPRTAQIPEMAEALANGINHATGVVKGRAPRGTNVALFAPRLEASRFMWLAGDPVKAADTFFRWKQSSPAERAFAVNQVKEKAWVAGTMLGALALNQGFLTAIGSKQKINFTDPMDSDFLRFKVGGMQFSYGSAMMNMAKLPGKLALAIAYEGKLSKLVLEDERISKLLFDYARSQASPFASITTDLATGRDYAGRPLPRKLFGTLKGDKDIPKRLRMHGITKPYSWPEWASEEFTPIPIEEGIKEVWEKGLGMSPKQQEQAWKALITISVMSATGGRLSEDYPKKK